jgi:hypothetical protein
VSPGANHRGAGREIHRKVGKIKKDPMRVDERTGHLLGPILIFPIF